MTDVMRPMKAARAIGLCLGAVAFGLLLAAASPSIATASPVAPTDYFNQATAYGPLNGADSGQIGAPFAYASSPDASLWQDPQGEIDACTSVVFCFDSTTGSTGYIFISDGGAMANASIFQAQLHAAAGATVLGAGASSVYGFPARAEAQLGDTLYFTAQGASPTTITTIGFTVRIHGTLAGIQGTDSGLAGVELEIAIGSVGSSPGGFDPTASNVSDPYSNVLTWYGAPTDVDYTFSGTFSFQGPAASVPIYMMLNASGQYGFANFSDGLSFSLNPLPAGVSYTSASGGFLSATPSPPDRANAHDANGDGVSDVLWLDTSGDLATWLMAGGANAGQTLSGVMLGNVGTSWSIAGTRDFNGDGLADILWMCTAGGSCNQGDIAIWLMNGTSVSSGVSLGNVGSQWTVAGTGDFNADGQGDILWRDGLTGEVAIWLMSNGAFSSGIDLGPVSSDWQIAGTGDFNGDGTTDILWHNTTTGDYAIWLMSNGQMASGADLGVVGGTWSVVGTGDFNGDDTSDILWHDGSGNLAIWLMSNGQFSSGATLGQVATTWSVVETGDFNGDGKSDILWLDQSGDLAVWLMNGAALGSGISLGNVGTSWHVQGQNAD